MKQSVFVSVAFGILISQMPAGNDRLITFDVQVIDSLTGEIPELLGPDDFQIFDNGQRVPVRKLAIETPPMDLVFVIYMTNPGLSTREDRKRYTDGLNAVATAVRKDDRAGVIRGGGPKGELLRLTGDHTAIRAALLRGPQAQPDKGRLLDAVSSALSLVSEQTPPDRRRAIVAITDDIDHHSETKEDALEASLLRSGVTLHEVLLALAPAGARVYGGGPRLPGVHLPRVNGIIGPGSAAGATSLVNLVRATGGEHQIGDDFDVAMPALIDRLRMRYALTIEVPRATKAFHKIEITLRAGILQAHPNFTVRTRTGYYSEP